MFVKLFEDIDIRSLEEQMNDFLADYDKGDVLSIDVKMGLTYNQIQEATYHYYTGIISYDEPR